jgi:hypothetical protein
VTGQPAVRITAHVTTTNPDIIARAIEAFSRAAAGLVLEHVTVEIFAGPDEDEEEGTE